MRLLVTILLLASFYHDHLLGSAPIAFDRHESDDSVIEMTTVYDNNFTQNKNHQTKEKPQSNNLFHGTCFSVITENNDFSKIICVPKHILPSACVNTSAQIFDASYFIELVLQHKKIISIFPLRI